MNEVARQDASTTDNYIYQIYNASGGNHAVVGMAKSLIIKIGDIYRFIEPTHYDGSLIVYKTMNDKDIIPNAKKSKELTNNFLLSPQSEEIIIQVLDDGTINLIEDKIDTDELFKSNEAVIYHYKDQQEYFFTNENKINIAKPKNAGSRYANWFSTLCEALEHYKNSIVLQTSSCSDLKKIWFDDNRIFLQGGGKDIPEKYMQQSLERYLKSCLRGVSVVREYNNGGSKPVDIRVSWGEAHRSALIEIKWLGKSRNAEGKITTTYTSRRIGEGAKQLKEYLDLEASDTPEIITKGYLIALDGRRKGTSEKTVDINREKGCFYQYIDESEQYKDYLKNIFNFERPYIMFAMPIVSSTC